MTRTHQSWRWCRNVSPTSLTPPSCRRDAAVAAGVCCCLILFGRLNCSGLERHLSSIELPAVVTKEMNFACSSDAIANIIDWAWSNGNKHSLHHFHVSDDVRIAFLRRRDENSTALKCFSTSNYPKRNNRWNGACTTCETQRWIVVVNFWASGFYKIFVACIRKMHLKLTAVRHKRNSNEEKILLKVMRRIDCNFVLLKWLIHAVIFLNFTKTLPGFSNCFFQLIKYTTAHLASENSCFSLVFHPSMSCITSKGEFDIWCCANDCSEIYIHVEFHNRFDDFSQREKLLSQIPYISGLRRPKVHQF